MAHSIYWHVPRRVCVVRAEGDISIKELAEISEESIEFVRSGDAPVHWITDARAIRTIPAHISQIHKMAKIFQETNLGWVLTLTDNRFMTFATSLVSQLARVNYKTFKDPVELIKTLQFIDPTLGEVPAYTEKTTST